MIRLTKFKADVSMIVHDLSAKSYDAKLMFLDRGIVGSRK